MILITSPPANFSTCSCSAIQDLVVKPSNVIFKDDIHFSWFVFFSNKANVINTVFVGKWVLGRVVFIDSKLCEGDREAIPKQPCIFLSINSDWNRFNLNNLQWKHLLILHVYYNWIAIKFTYLLEIRILADHVGYINFAIFTIHKVLIMIRIA